jgi:hypothetical protein
LRCGQVAIAQRRPARRLRDRPDAVAHRGQQVAQARQRGGHRQHGFGHLVAAQRHRAGAQVALGHAVHLVVQRLDRPPRITRKKV